MIMAFIQLDDVVVKGDGDGSTFREGFAASPACSAAAAGVVPVEPELVDHEDALATMLDERRYLGVAGQTPGYES